MACFSTTHFPSQDKHLRASSLRRSGEGAGNLAGAARGGRGAAAASPPAAPGRSAPGQPARPRTAPHGEGPCLQGTGGAFLSRLNAKRRLAGRVAELTSTHRVGATSCRFAIASTCERGVWVSGCGRGIKDPNVPKFRKSCENFPKLVRFEKKVPLLLKRCFISQSSEGKGLAGIAHFVAVVLWVKQEPDSEQFNTVL